MFKLVWRRLIENHDFDESREQRVGAVIPGGTNQRCSCGSRRQTHLTQALAVCSAVQYDIFTRSTSSPSASPAVGCGCKPKCQCVFHTVRGSRFCHGLKNTREKNVNIESIQLKRICFISFMRLMRTLLLSGALRSLQVAFFHVVVDAALRSLSRRDLQTVKDNFNALLKFGYLTEMSRDT